MEEVRRKLFVNGLTFLKGDESKNGKPKFIYSFTLLFEGNEYPMWLEIQFSNKIVIGINLNDHVDYELRRLKRGDMKTADMKQRFTSYSKYCHHADKDNHDVQIILKLLEQEVLVSSHDVCLFVKFIYIPPLKLK